jgi:hypothetical protein
MSEQAARAGSTAETLTARLRRVEAWRRARFRRLVNELDSDTTRTRIILAARLYLSVHVRRQALESSVIETLTEN